METKKNVKNTMEKAFDEWDRVKHKREYEDLKKFTDAYCEKAGMSQGSVVRDLYKYDIEMRKEAFIAGQEIASKEFVDFIHKWSLDIQRVNFLQKKEINKYHSERRKILEKYNYKE